MTCTAHCKHYAKKYGTYAWTFGTCEPTFTTHGLTLANQPLYFP